MGVADSTRAKAQAACSEAQADVKELEAQLSSAKSRAKLADASDSVVETLTSPPVIKENTEFLRKRTEANAADAKAKVDRTIAELNSARNRLKWAERALNAIDGVSEAVSDLMDTDDDLTQSRPTDDYQGDDSTRSRGDSD
jgi:ectoine hydroxylase-related dioxygenase (phytanoyl-CoA dioxygenase family)